MSFHEDRCTSVRSLPDGGHIEENWRKLSGEGTTPLAGAWETKSEHEHWMSIVTSAHYGVIQAGTGRPTAPSEGDEYSDAEIVSMWERFGANAGARIETPQTFEHWPFLGGNAPGYEARKHPTFRVSDVNGDRHMLSIPPYVPSDQAEEWTKLR